jgi:hypothetical protein
MMKALRGFFLVSQAAMDQNCCSRCWNAKLSEQRIQQEIRLAISHGDTKVFRNNTGTLRDQNGRPVQFGLCKGSADLIGWRTVTVTPDMVGQRLAVFTSIEVKTPTGRLRPEQQQWLDAVQAAGGIAGVARSVEDARALVCDKTDTPVRD